MLPSSETIDYASVLMVDVADVEEHLVSILHNQFRCKVDVVNSESEIFDKLKNSYHLILIADKQSGLLGKKLAKLIREFESANNLKITPVVSLLLGKTENQTENNKSTNISDYHVLLMSNLNVKEMLSKWLSVTSPFKDEGSLIKNVIDTSTIDTFVNSISSEFSELIEESINLFFEQYVENVKNLRITWENQDEEGFRQTAHFMKSSSYTIGANKLGSLFCYLETHMMKDKEEFESTLQKLNLCFVTTKKELLSYLKGKLN